VSDHPATDLTDDELAAQEGAYDEPEATGAMAALDDVYAERNDAVLGFATLAMRVGYKVGYLADPAEPDWPVLMIDTPEGQVSWHFKRGELPRGIPAYDGEWDGHDTPEKYARLRRFVDDCWRLAEPDYSDA
jgi:hypothetical protein